MEIVTSLLAVCLVLLGYMIWREIQCIRRLIVATLTSHAVERWEDYVVETGLRTFQRRHRLHDRESAALAQERRQVREQLKDDSAGLAEAEAAWRADDIERLKPDDDSWRIKDRVETILIR
jgi:hypothetical protein